MAEIKLFYKSCDCCSGSSGCNCSFLTEGLDDGMLCNGFDVVTKCNFVVNINLDFSGCGSTPIGSCSSGSSASGAETGLDGPETGSTPDCLTTCPDCCDLINQTYQFNLECVGNTLASENLIDGNCGSSIDFESGSSCLGQRTDKCSFFYISVTGTSFFGQFFVPIDNGGLQGVFTSAFIVSCDPFQMTGFLFFGRALGLINEPCLAQCLNRTPGFFADIDPAGGIDTGCISGTFTITEALP